MDQDYHFDQLHRERDTFTGHLPLSIKLPSRLPPVLSMEAEFFLDLKIKLNFGGCDEWLLSSTKLSVTDLVALNHVVGAMKPIANRSPSTRMRLGRYCSIRDVQAS